MVVDVVLRRQLRPELGRFGRRIVSQCDGTFAPDLRRRIVGEHSHVRNHVELQIPADAQASDAEVGIAVLDCLLDVFFFAAFDAGEQVQRAGAHPGVVPAPELQ